MIRTVPPQFSLPPAKRQKIDTNAYQQKDAKMQASSYAYPVPCSVHQAQAQAQQFTYPLPQTLQFKQQQTAIPQQIQHYQSPPQQQRPPVVNKPLASSISNATKELIQNLAPPVVPKPSREDIHHENDVWFWDRSGRGTDFQPFEPSVNKQINEGYMQRKPKIIVSFNSKQYEIYFIAMVQRNCSSGTQRLLTCLSAVHYAIPRWVPLFPNNSENRGHNFQLLAMAREDVECKAAARFFMETMPTASVMTIQKVENRFLRKAWEFSREQVCEKSGKADNVKLLFHGTRTTNPLVICNSDQGFLPQCAGVGMWGPGTYFSEKSAYSDRYSYKLTPQEIQQEFPNTPTTTNLRQILLCEVIVGDSCYSFPNKLLRIPPQKKTQSNSPLGFAVDRYDSVWGITYGTKVYITYDTTRAYPTYLITYQDSFS